MADTFIWVDHLEDLARVARAADKFESEINKTMENNMSDLEYVIPEIEVKLYGDTNWSIVKDPETEAWSLKIREDK